MIRKNNSREPRNGDPRSQSSGRKNWIIHLIDKGLDSIVAAGPVAWMSVVCIVALCAVVVIVYIMAGAPPRVH
jgi:hypothetical protein